MSSQSSGRNLLGAESSFSELEDSPVHVRKAYHCGIGPCRPKQLQRFASTKFFTFMLCINALIEGALVSGKCLYYCIKPKAAVFC